MSSGPIAWSNASTHALFDVLDDAIPSSTIRAASTMSSAISREVMKPCVSFWQTIVSLP